MRLADDEAKRRAAAADHGVLCTVHPARGVDAVPACFALEGDLVAVPVDRLKPKASTELQRQRNLARDPRAALLCESWDATDWSRLWWVRLGLVRSEEPAATMARLEAALRDKYPQYRSAPDAFASILTFRIREVSGWAASALANGSTG